MARAAFRKGGSLPIRIRDELGSWYEDGDFAAAYAVRGAPGISPAQLAMVTVLQFTENLTDRQAADEVRGRVDWKYCLGLELEDEGFEFTALNGFRERLLAGGAERVLFDRLLDLLKERGLVKAGGRQRTDSTHVLARIRDLNRLELAGETVRAALEALAAAAPGWLAGVIDASWQRVYGQRIDNLRLPESQAAREELAVQYGRDGYYLLEQAGGPGAPGWLAGLPAVQALRRIWIQQYYRDIGEDGEKVIRREEREHGLPPGRDRIVSPYDLDARYSEKHGMSWLGYKGHFTETVSDPGDDDPDTGRPAVPNLVTDVQTTHAAVPDVVMTAPVHDSLQAAGLPPGEQPSIPGTSPRTCWWPPGGAASPCSARCWQTSPRRPVPAATPRRRSPSTGTASRSPARRAPSAASGRRCARDATARRRSASGSPRPPAAAARRGTSAPRRNGPGGSCTCARARSTRPSPPPAQARTPGSGRTGTKPAPVSREPWPRPATSPESAAPATPACPRPAWSTWPPPPPST